MKRVLILASLLFASTLALADAATVDDLEVYHCHYTGGPLQ
jgi:hypothetical protein